MHRKSLAARFFSVASARLRDRDRARYMLKSTQNPGDRPPDYAVSRPGLGRLFHGSAGSEKNEQKSLPTRASPQAHAPLTTLALNLISCLKSYCKSYISKTPFIMLIRKPRYPQLQQIPFLGNRFHSNVLVSMPSKTKTANLWKKYFLSALKFLCSGGQISFFLHSQLV